MTTVNYIIFDPNTGVIISKVNSPINCAVDTPYPWLEIEEWEDEWSATKIVSNPSDPEPTLIDTPSIEVSWNGTTKVLSNLPVPSVLIIDEDIYELEDDEIELDFDLPGVYSIRVIAVGYLPLTYEITIP